MYTHTQTHTAHVYVLIVMKLTITTKKKKTHIMEFQFQTPYSLAGGYKQFGESSITYILQTAAVSSSEMDYPPTRPHYVITYEI